MLNLERKNADITLFTFHCQMPLPNSGICTILCRNWIRSHPMTSQSNHYCNKYTHICITRGRSKQGRRHGFKSGGGTILRVERAKKIFL